MFFDAADSAGDYRFRFEREDAVAVIIVESDAENGEVGGELGVGAVEEDVLLIVRLDVVRREKIGEFLLR